MCGYMYRFKNPSSPLSLYREPSFGHGRLNIVNESHAHWSWQRNNDSDAFEADQVWIDSLRSSKACWDDAIQLDDLSTDRAHDEF